MLDIYAGANALKTIKENGFSQKMFSTMLGASGGPKWFTLFGLDKYLFGEFFNGRSSELNVIGSSAGAFRTACFAQKDPVAAISRLADKYSKVTYTEKPNADEISQSAIDILAYMFAGTGDEEIINNKIIKAHFIVAKSKGLTAHNNKVSQTAGLIASLMLNKVDRRLLKHQYERYIYRAPSSTIEINDPYNFSSHYVDLTKENIKTALIASGSIPLVMSGIKDIANSPKGMYRDGGIIDYHFDLTVNNPTLALPEQENLTLYPHFNAQPKAGWFDKNSSRKVLASSYDNTVLLVPSAQFIDSLPYKKIPDRNDFKNLDDASRLKYWQTVLSETERLADSFAEFLSSQNIAKIKAFN